MKLCFSCIVQSLFQSRWTTHRLVTRAGSLLVLALFGAGCSGSGSGDQGSQPSGSPDAWRLKSVDQYYTDSAFAAANYTLIYDNQGVSVGEDVDQGSDGQLDERFTYAYEAGLLIRSELDSDLDGQLDTVRYFDYDDSGLLLKESVDDSFDGIINRVVEYSISTDGDVVARFDDDNDQLPDAIYSFKRDELDRLVGIEIDANANGVVDEMETVSYGSDGFVSTSIRVNLSTSQIVSRLVFHYESGLCAEATNHQPRRYGCIYR